MDKIEQRNRQALRMGFPELYARVCALSRGELKPEDEVSVVEAMETLGRTDALCVKMQDGRLVRLNSAYDPEHEAAIWADGQKGLTASNLFIFGLGNGVFARELLQRRGQHTRIVIYEPSVQIFLYAMKRFDLSFCFQTEGVWLIVEGLNEDLFSGVMEKMITIDNYKDYAFVFCPLLQTLFPESRKRLLELYASKGIAWMERWQKIERYQLHISPYNQLHNLQHLERNTVVPYLKKIFPKNIPVILIGAGPSLENEVEVLRAAKGKAFLFAADSALSFLLRNNVIPDAYICIEATKPMSFFREEEAREIPLFAKVDSTHQLLDVHRGPKIFGHDMGFPQTVYQEYDVPQSEYRYGSNGMTALFSICDEMGVETVIFVGQDMCFGANKHSHAGARNEGYVKNKLFLRENNQGEMVQSRADWSELIDWYENAIMDCSMRHVINTSFQGVRIRGTDVMSLKDALEQYGKENDTDFSELVSRANRTFDQARPFDIKAFYCRCREELKQLEEVTDRNPQSEERKKYRIYKLLEKYEVADRENGFEKSQKQGIGKLREYMEQCIAEVEG